MTNRLGTTQAVAFTGTAAASANAFGAQTYRVRVVADTACHIVFGASPTATTSDPFLPANWPEYFTVTPGQKISGVRAGTDGLVTATSGSLWVTELD